MSAASGGVYEISAADRMVLPAAYRTEDRHVGYDETEKTRPFAHYFQPEARPIQDHVRQALVAGEAPAEQAYELEVAADRLLRPGYDAFETGWTRTDRGTLVVACRTDMPGVTAEMWDWWFGWHGTDSARYKLWHPTAHIFSAVGDDRSADRALTDRQRYLDNVSYVDEYIGGVLERLAIRFFDPARLGFDEQSGTTHICARAGTSEVPIASGWLIHQVRPTEHGSEMRSRFFLGHPQVLDLPPHSVSKPPAARLLRTGLGRRLLSPMISKQERRVSSAAMGHALLEHCAEEMNHLAGFLPALYEEFEGTP